MRRKIVPIVDLFSGPGGLGEGFSAYRSPGDRRRYRAALSIEKDPSAYRTLRLRAFLRKFRAGFPPEYYDFLNGVIPKEPDWAKLYPKHWTAACDETRCLELGTSSASTFLEQRIARIRTEHEGRTVLLGGPPCQVYSVAGRSRNSGKIGYDADEDDRQLLYEPYVQVLSQLQPAIAVMENVKGMLSARRNGRLIFPEVMRKLLHAGSINAYQLFALAPPSGICSWDEASKPRDFLVHAEEHSVPQARHRVFVICVRRDVAEALPEECLPRLDRQAGTVSVRDIISAMPKLRSRLSQNDDPGSWQDAVRSVYELILANRPMMSQDEERRFRMALGRPCSMPRGPRRRGGKHVAGLPCLPVVLPTSATGYPTRRSRCCPTMRREGISRRSRPLPVRRGVRSRLRAISEDPGFSRGADARPCELEHGEVRRPLSGAAFRWAVHDGHESPLKGRPLFHSSRPGSVPEPYRAGGGTPSDLSGQLLFPRQSHAAVHSGGQCSPAFSRLADCPGCLGHH